jgi:SagB-type dehydrogenase family enzyme
VTDCHEVVRLRPGVFLAVDTSGQGYLLHRSSSQRLGELTQTQRSLLAQLAAAECSGESLRKVACDASGESGVAELHSLLRQLRAGGWLHIRVVRDGRPVYTIEPFRRPDRPEFGGPEDRGAELVLSRFAILHRSGSDLVIESPRSWCTIRVHDPGVVAALGALIGAGGISSRESAPEPLAGRLRSGLAWAGLLVPASGAEDTAFELRLWSAHELWFHLRSRGEGVPGEHFGRTKWAAGEFKPLPARRPAYAGQSIGLHRPDLDELRHSDATLTGVLEERRSIRQHDDSRPITVQQIGEFLYRAAGVRDTLAVGDAETVTGPNPSGGALGELEFYLAVRLAAGLEPGLYRYDRFGHRLEQVCGPTRPVRRLIDAAQNATGGSEAMPRTYPPQLVILLAARFGRVGWSYETLGYSLILKHVGVTYQTMYCVATAMGLAPCALGAGDPAVFAQATGLDPLTEGTVGEFILGSRPAGGTGDRDQRAAT